MEAVDKMALFLHLLNCFFLIFVLFLSTCRDLALRSRIFLQSLCSFSLVMTTLLG